jgi:hypothetical protein
LPDKLVYKLTYPIKGHSQEGPLFSRFFGQFGIGNVLGFHSCGPEEPHGSTQPFFRNAVFWSIIQDKQEGVHYKPEERGLQCIALSAEGKALLDLNNENGGIPSPAELLETILHAIIGKQYSLCVTFYSPLPI